MSLFKSWKETRHIRIGEEISEEQFKELYKVVAAQNKIKKFLSLIWNILLGLCAIVAAVFSVLAFFK